MVKEYRRGEKSQSEKRAEERRGEIVRKDQRKGGKRAGVMSGAAERGGGGRGCFVDARGGERQQIKGSKLTPARIHQSMLDKKPISGARGSYGGASMKDFTTPSSLLFSSIPFSFYIGCSLSFFFSPPPFTPLFSLSHQRSLLANCFPPARNSEVMPF